MAYPIGCASAEAGLRVCGTSARRINPVLLDAPSSIMLMVSQSSLPCDHPSHFCNPLLSPGNKYKHEQIEQTQQILNFETQLSSEASGQFNR